MAKSNEGRKSRLVPKLLIGLVLIGLAIQFVPVTRSNPPETAALVAEPAMVALLERSCMDCHSNRTRWPWYSYVAPVSWLVAHDVEEGREHLNFSSWGSMSPAEQAEMAHECVEEVEKGKMPMDIYTWTHGDAVLSQQDQELLRSWASSFGPARDHEDGEDEEHEGHDEREGREERGGRD
jgi:hypothetical protein